MVPNTRIALVGLLAVLLVAVCAGLVMGPGGIATELYADEFQPDDFVIDIHLPGDDTAEWTIEHRYRLADDEDEAAFDDLAADIAENTDAYLDRFDERMAGTVDASAEATDRDMAMTDVSVETERRALPQEYGIVRYTFVWHGFTVVEDDRLEAGDAIAGLFLDGESVLRMSWSDTHEVESVNPEPTERGETSAVWRGPIEFGADEPRVNLATGHLSIVGTTQFALIAAILLLITGAIGWWMLRGKRGRDGDIVEVGDDEDLLSNEERVLQLIQTEGGRMKQQEVVDRLGWTDAKTSQVVSNLREDEEIESFRLGRENVLRLPEEASEE